MIPCPLSEELRPLGCWKHGPIPVIGLIGGIGSGKSRLAQRLAAWGATVLDADAVGHQWLRDAEVRHQIVERFGTGVLSGPRPGSDDAPPVDRQVLGAIVFADPWARAALEAIVHPRMRASFLAAIGRAQRESAPGLVVLDAAILLEAGWDDLCDRIVFVDAPRPERWRRVAAARGWSEETFAARERAQWPVDQKQRRADWVLTNATGQDRLDEEADRLVCWLRDTAPRADAPGSDPIEAPAAAAAWAMPKTDTVTLTPSDPVENAP